MTELLNDFQSQRLFLDIVLLLVLIPSLYYDLVQNRIPNFLTVSGMVFGILAAFLLGTSAQIQGHLFGLILGFGFFYILYIFGWVGGGDVKLMGAIGSLKGVAFLVNVLIYTSILGGIIALLFLLKAFIKKENFRKLKVPYGTAICLGTFVSLAIQYGLMSQAV